MSEQNRRQQSTAALRGTFLPRRRSGVGPSRARVALQGGGKKAIYIIIIMVLTIIIIIATTMGSNDGLQSMSGGGDIALSTPYTPNLAEEVNLDQLKVSAKAKQKR